MIMRGVAPELTANQRSWNRQKNNPAMCRYGCGMKIVFMKDALWRTIPCEARKIVVVKDGQKIMEESGLITRLGRRVGWPVHDCLAERAQQTDDTIPPPTLMPIERDPSHNQP